MPSPRASPRASSCAAAEPQAFVPMDREATDNHNLELLLGFTLAADAHCIDIGAHHGRFLWSIQRHAPLGRHVAFEPLPQLAAELRENFPKVDVHEVRADRRRGRAGVRCRRRGPRLQRPARARLPRGLQDPPDHDPGRATGRHDRPRPARRLHQDRCRGRGARGLRGRPGDPAAHAADDRLRAWPGRRRPLQHAPRGRLGFADRRPRPAHLRPRRRRPAFAHADGRTVRLGDALELRRAQAMRGVNVVGPFEAELGVAEIARQVVAALDAVAIPVLPLGYVAGASRQGHPYPHVPVDDAGDVLFDTTILCVNADGMPHFRSASASASSRGATRSACGGGRRPSSPVDGRVVRAGRRGLGRQRLRRRDAARRRARRAFPSTASTSRSQRRARDSPASNCPPAHSPSSTSSTTTP